MREQTPKDSRLVRGKPSWDELDAMYAEAVRQVAALSARCTALEQERDKEQNKADVRGNMLRYIAFVTTGDETGDAQLGVDRLHTRCQHLEQAVKDLGDAGEMLCVVLANVSGGMWRLQTQDWQNAAAKWRDHYYATIASLLPPQEETQTDENRVSFAAGYTAALDDALKGTT